MTDNMRTSPKTSLYNRDIYFRQCFGLILYFSSLVTKFSNICRKLECIEKITVKKRNHLTYPVRLQNELN